MTLLVGIRFVETFARAFVQIQNLVLKKKHLLLTKSLEEPLNKDLFKNFQPPDKLVFSPD